MKGTKQLGKRLTACGLALCLLLLGACAGNAGPAGQTPREASQTGELAGSTPGLLYEFTAHIEVEIFSERAHEQADGDISDAFVDTKAGRLYLNNGVVLSFGESSFGYSHYFWLADGPVRHLYILVNGNEFWRYDAVDDTVRGIVVAAHGATRTDGRGMVQSLYALQPGGFYLCTADALYWYDGARDEMELVATGEITQFVASPAGTAVLVENSEGALYACVRGENPKKLVGEHTQRLRSISDDARVCCYELEGGGTRLYNTAQPTLSYTVGFDESHQHNLDGSWHLLADDTHMASILCVYSPESGETILEGAQSMGVLGWNLYAGGGVTHIYGTKTREDGSQDIAVWYLDAEEPMTLATQARQLHADTPNERLYILAQNGDLLRVDYSRVGTGATSTLARGAEWFLPANECLIVYDGTEVYKLDFDGRQLSSFTPPAHVLAGDVEAVYDFSAPACSPDGSAVAFACNVNGEQRAYIYTESGGLVQLKAGNVSNAPNNEHRYFYLPTGGSAPQAYFFDGMDSVAVG